jgi:ribonuclease HI
VYSVNTGLNSAFIVELYGAMRAIQIANGRNWKNLWLETDSALVVMAFKSPDIVPSEVCNRWLNCSRITKNMNLVVSHVYREGNQCADGLANIGLNLDRLVIWDVIPSQIRSFYFDNRLGKPSFRIA